jgi:hypothetical protein
MELDSIFESSFWIWKNVLELEPKDLKNWKNQAQALTHSVKIGIRGSPKQEEPNNTGSHIIHSLW